MDKKPQVWSQELATALTENNLFLAHIHIKNFYDSAYDDKFTRLVAAKDKNSAHEKVDEYLKQYITETKNRYKVTISEIIT